jgi:predicted dehydrogenase
MINLAVIGTSWISEKFVEAAIQSNQFRLMAVYSRRSDKAHHFAKNHQDKNCNYYNTLEDLAREKAIDAVYIASPNSLHCAQAILLMEHGKHVICEKPIASNISEATRMYRSAEEHKVILFEAFKTEFLPNFEELRANLTSIGKMRNVYLSYCQYSSRYQKYLNGENPNTFNPIYSNGSIMDIGFYCVSAAVSLFGRPDKIQSNAKLLDSGVDTHGTVILEYPTFLVTLQHSKVSNGNVASEFQGEDGIILVKNISECDAFTLQKRGGTPQVISVEQEDNSMLYEAIAFAKQIHEGSMNLAYVQRSLEVARVTTEIRMQTGVKFPADN